MQRDYVNVGILWFILTFIGELMLPALNLFPFLASEQGATIDSAFSYLLIMSIPVFAFVVAALVYSIFRFRDRGEDRDGVPTKNNNLVYVVWLLVTTALAISILIYPGVVGVSELRADNNAELVVEVMAEQWNWTYTYPESDVTLRNATELVLPVDTTVKFEVTATDVVHSFWVPAFRMKIDAVPGKVTEMYVTTSAISSTAEESTVRVQCAELCGTGHANMSTSLTVMEQDEFEAWLASQAQNMDMSDNQ
jgi:cytochrome c oxidase subunit II